MVSKFISLLMGQAHLARSFLIGAATVLLLFQLPSGYCDNARESATPVTSGQTANDADGVNASNHGTPTGSELGGAPTSGTAPANSSPTSDKGGQVNVKTYGAVGDGVTDDTAAFIAALKSVAEAGGGMCLVPEGTYLISASGISTGGHRPSVLSGVHLMGAGRGASILKLAGMPTNHLLQCDGDNWSVENLTFDMGDYTPSGRLGSDRLQR